jgi:hypothetical protein
LKKKENKYSILEIVKLLFSMCGLFGGIFVFFLISINYRFLGYAIEELTMFYLFLIFTFFCMITIFIDRIRYFSKKDNQLRRHSLRIAYIGLIINGFGIFTGLPGYLY